MGTHFLGGLNMRPVAVPNATTYKVLVKDSGKLHIMPDLSSTCTITLPTVENGLKFEFMYAGAADEGQNWVVKTADAGELFKGGVTQLDPTEATLSEVTPVYADFSNDDTFTAVTPNAGTSVTFVSDGASWFVNGFVVSDTLPTFA